MSLDGKLAVFDEEADNAIRFLVSWLTNSPEEIIAVARGRHITGHYVFGDKNFLEWDDGRLQAELLQELADGVVYATRLLSRRASSSGRSSSTGA